MKFSRLIIPALVSSLLLSLVPATAVADEAVPISIEKTDYSDIVSELDTPLSPGLRVISFNSPVILSGLTGEDIRFTAEDFGDHSGSVPTSIKILSLPAYESGTLTYDSTPVNSGQTVSVLSFDKLRYDPDNTDDAEFVFSPDGVTAVRCIMRQRDTENTPPEAKSNDTVTTFTGLNAPVSGYLSGNDPDGDSVSFEITDYPDKGVLRLADSDKGYFIYSPYRGMSGSDSFSYRIRDCYGEYSGEVVSRLSIDSEVVTVFDDMSESYSNSAVHNAVKSGIMQTRTTADGEFFDPDKPVSRIDFLIMAMKAMGAGDPEQASSTVFADDDTLNSTEKGYLAAAYRLEIINGSESDGKLYFMPDDPVTGASAAVILNGILGLPEDDSVSVASMGDVPAWAIPSISALASEGIINRYSAPANGELTREDTAVILTGLARRLG